ncbi:MAG: CRISPR-associated endonuclease Cas1 [Acidobacteriales bacterium]|nr:CRISPR-associated endonuclease Cas1 [Terriglobales bacterium]
MTSLKPAEAVAASVASAPAEPFGPQIVPAVARQMNLFTGEAEAPSLMVEAFPPGESERVLEDGITVVASPEGMAVHISGWGAYLGKKSERLVLRKKGGTGVLWQVPLDQIHEVHLAANGVSISSDALAELADRGVRVSLLAANGRPVAQISSPNLTASVAIRRAQLEALGSERGLRLAQAMAAGKLLNQARLLKYFAKNLRSAEPAQFAELGRRIAAILALRRNILKGAWPSLEEARPAVMGLEGTAARHYWDAVTRLIEKHAEFPGRAHRGAADFVNSLLNYGYGVLYAQVWSAVLNAGLEPFAGFLHTDRPGKPSLVLDLTEEFRAPVVDRTVLAAIRLRQLQPQGTPGPLAPDVRAVLVDLLLRRLESKERFQGGDYQVRSIIQRQARSVASFLQGRSERYQPFRFKW